MIKGRCERKEDDIKDAIGKIKTSRGFGTDNFSSYFLKLAMPYIENALAYIFNSSLKSSKFTADWKPAWVTPIFNEGDKSDKSNYRPIPVLPVVSRLFEKLVFNQSYQYLDRNGLLSPNQSGFRRLHSTLTCLLKSTDDWFTGLDSGEMLGMVFVDLKTAFDTIDHRNLCDERKLHGVQQRELYWFKGYLSNRSQYCSVGGYDSNVGELEVGVPQRPCLGSLLFLIYINDLPKTTQGKVSMNADDSSLCHMSNDISKLEYESNEDLELLDNWLEGNKLSLNVAKTKSMLICTKSRRKIINSNDDELNLLIRDRELESVDVIKYLGEHVDHSLSWKDHL